MDNKEDKDMSKNEELEKTDKRMRQDMLLQLHEQYAVNNNANLSTVMTLIVAAIAIFGAYGYVYVNTSMSFAKDIGSFGDCFPSSFTIDVLLIITIAIFVIIGILQYICMYQGCHQRYEQFTTYAARYENGLKVGSKEGEVFSKDYHPFYKCENEDRNVDCCTVLYAVVCPNHGMECIVQGLFGEFVKIFSYLLWIIYMSTVLKLLLALCDNGDYTCLTIAIIIILHIFILTVNLLIGNEAIKLKNKYKDLCEEFNKYRPLKEKGTSIIMTMKCKCYMMQILAWLLLLLGIVLICFHVNEKDCDIFNIISLALAIGSILFAVYVFWHDKKSQAINRLANQVQAFYLEEDILIQDICKYRKGEKLEDKSESTTYRTVKTEYRNKAEKHPKNVRHIRPSMAYCEAESYRKLT